MATETIYEYRPDAGTLTMHGVPGEAPVTACGLQTWSPETDPSVDPTGIVPEEVWYSAQDVAPELLRECPVCFP